MRSMTKQAVETPPANVPKAEGRILALALTVLVMPFPRVLWSWGNHPGDYSFQAYVFPVDLALLALLLLSVRPLVAKARNRSTGLVTAASGLLLVAMLVAFAFHPSTRGALTVFRLAGVIAAVDAIASLRGMTERTVVVGALVVTTAFQAVIAVLQRLNGGHPIGLSAVGEQAIPWTGISGARATFGTMVHVYVLAALGAVTVGVCIAAALQRSIPRQLAVFGVVAGAVPMAITYSRMSVIAAVGVVLALGWRAVMRRRAGEDDAAGRRLAAQLLLVLVVSLVVPAAIAPSAWAGRASQSTGGTAEGIDTGRVSLMHQAVDLLAKHPLTGVGPGRYSFAVQADPQVFKLDSRGFVLPVHDVPLLVAAEGGLLAVLALLAIAFAIGWQTRRAGVAGVVVLVSLVPFLLLDHLNWTFPQGLVLLALWLGAVDALGRGAWVAGEA